MVWVSNVLIPGTGLILRRREWLGFLLALSFGICSNIAIGGILITPEAIPRWMIFLAGALSVSLWIAAQVFLLRQIGRQGDSGAQSLPGPLGAE